MRVLILSAFTKQKRFLSFAQRLHGLLQAKGHYVNLIDVTRESGGKIRGYNYLIVYTECISLFGGKIPDVLVRYLSQLDSMGFKSCALVQEGLTFGRLKALQRTMSALESEGIIVHYSDLVSSKVSWNSLIDRMQLNPQKGHHGREK